MIPNILSAQNETEKEAFADFETFLVVVREKYSMTFPNELKNLALAFYVQGRIDALNKTAHDFGKIFNSAKPN